MRCLFLGWMWIGLPTLLAAQDERRPAQPADVAGKVALALNTGGHATPIQGLAFTPDGRKLITAEHQEVHVWNVATGAQERTWRLPAEIRKIALSPDGKTIAATHWGAGTRTSLWVLDVPSGQARVTHSPLYAVERLAFSANGRRLACANPEAVSIWSFQKDWLSHVLKRKGVAESLAFSRDGNQFLVAGGNPQGTEAAQVWDVKGNRPGLNSIQLDKPLFSLENATRHAVAWAPDGSRFASWDR